MFLRLLKQDLRATARVMIVLYAVVLVLSGATRVMTSFMDQNVGGLLVVVFARLLVILFAVAVAACVVMTFVLMIIRFYKNFLTDEGYLMFTLPVTKGQLIWSKLLVSLVWAFASGVVGVLVVFILTVGTDAQDILFSFGWLKELFSEFSTGENVMLVALFVVLVLLWAAYVYLKCYAAMAVGQSFGNHKFLFSVIFFIGFGIVERILTFSILNPLMTMENLADMAADAEPFSVLASVLGGIDGYYVVLCAVYFVVTYLFFKKKLNLQ